MRKLLITTIIALSAFTASAQSTKHKQEVNPVDSTKIASITVKISPEQLGQITSILNQASSVISKSDAPYREGVQTVQALSAVIAFFKQYEPQPKK